MVVVNSKEGLIAGASIVTEHWDTTDTTCVTTVQ